MEANVFLRPSSLFFFCVLNNLNCSANTTDTVLVFQVEMEIMPFISWVESPVYPVFLALWTIVFSHHQLSCRRVLQGDPEVNSVLGCTVYIWDPLLALECQNKLQVEYNLDKIHWKMWNPGFEPWYWFNHGRTQSGFWHGGQGFISGLLLRCSLCASSKPTPKLLCVLCHH